MNRSITRRIQAAMLIGLAIVTLTVSPAVARPSAINTSPAVTRVTFKLHDHQVKQGVPVAGTVRVQMRSGNVWAPIAGATVAVKVDGVQIATAVTDASGSGPILVAGSAIGGHVMRVMYAGDLGHKGSEGSQGFEVSP